MRVRVVPHGAGPPERPIDDDGPSTSGREYLTQFVHRLLDYRRPELESLAEMASCRTEELRWRMPAGDVEESPFWYMTLPSEETVQQIGKRMLLTKVGTVVGLCKAPPTLQVSLLMVVKTPHTKEQSLVAAAC